MAFVTKTYQQASNKTLVPINVPCTLIGASYQLIYHGTLSGKLRYGSRPKIESPTYLNWPLRICWLHIFNIHHIFLKILNEYSLDFTIGHQNRKPIKSVGYPNDSQKIKRL